MPSNVVRCHFSKSACGLKSVERASPDSGIVFVGLVGIVAGLYPTIRAARLSPVEALRTD